MSCAHRDGRQLVTALGSANQSAIDRKYATTDILVAWMDGWMDGLMDMDGYGDGWRRVIN